MPARCPICSMELADVNAVRQHTRAEHSTGPDQDTSQGWVSVAGPGPAGWYPDPWNSRSQRYWDGTQWSGRTAPLDAPPEPTPEPAMAAPRARATAGPAPVMAAGGPAPVMAAGRPAPSAGADLADRSTTSSTAAGLTAGTVGPGDVVAGSDVVAGRDVVAGSVAVAGSDVVVGSVAVAGSDVATRGDVVGGAGATRSTAPAPRSSPPEPGSPEPPSRSAIPSLPGMTRSLAGRLPVQIWAAVAAAVAVLVIVIVMSGVSSSNPQSLVVAPADPVTTAPAGPSALAAGVLTARDLGAGWTAYPPGHPLAASTFTTGPCHSPLWNGDVGGYESSFINGTNADAAHGAVVSQVFEASSGATAVAQQQFIAAPAFLPCLEQKVTAEAESQFPKAAGWAVTGEVANPFQPQLGTTSTVGWVLMVSVRDGFGSTSVLTDDSVETFTGPYEATLDVSWNSKAPLTQEIVQAQATTEAKHLAALPPGGIVAPTG